MAEENAEAELDWSGQPSLLDEDTFYAMEGLQATLQQLEAELRQKDVSEQSSTEYCDNFCQALMHFAGSRNSVEHGLALLEVYCLSINCFAAARPYLTADSSSVTLVLKRLALSCLELLLSVPHNEIPLEAWLQFHGSVQAAHEAMLQYGSTDLQALLNITGEGGAWNNPVLVSLLTSQPTEPDKVNDYLALEGEGFMEMRIKHLEKVGEVEKALILNKACANCPLLPNQATFRQTFVTQLCQMLPSEEAIIEISRIDGKDVLDIICNMETEGDENTAFVLCTTYFTQQLQQESLYCAWELTLLWSKLQRRIDASLESFFERCLQFGAIAKTIYHLLFLIRVIQTEAMQLGLAISVELCVKALQLPRQDDVDARTMVCKTVACLLPEDLEVIRGCQLTEFLLSPCQEAFDILKELYTQPDQKYDEENGIIPNFLRCELLLSLKAHWPFDPEFWDWKTLKRHCIGLLGLEPEEEDEAVPEEHCNLEPVLSTLVEAKEEDKGEINGLCSSLQEQTAENTDEEVDQESFDSKDGLPSSQRSMKWQDYKFTCKICNKETVEVRICHHAKKHLVDNLWTCPFCLKKFKNRPQFVKHAKKHIQMPSRVRHFKKKKVKKKVVSRKNDFRDEGFDDLEPGQIPLDPSLAMYYQSTHDPVVLEHILEQAASVPKKQEDEDYITFDYINTYFKLQDRDVYQCPATDCSKNFKLFKYLGVHVKNEHDNEDPNVKHYLKMKDSREKCAFCRKTFMTAYHHRKHRHVHYGDNPYICVVSGCGARFNTTTELVLHKQSHGFRLSYSCELKGCSFSYCDLGQLYHHEAQHFRDAAYTCTSPGCKHFFYCRKEFLKHLAIHGITFTEKDFDMQRKAKKKKLLAVVDNMGPELDNDTQKSLSSPNLECSESKASLTCVAVCFDGKKFTCGLKQCGGTFTTARDLQRHLKNAHKDEYVNEDNLCKKTAQAKESMSQDDKLHKNDLDCIARSSTEETTQEKAVLTVAESLDSNTTPSNVELCASLCEIMQGFSQLSLSSTAPHVRRNSPRSVTASKLPVVVCPPTLNAKSPAKASPSKKTEVRSHLPGSDSKNPENLDDKKDYVKEKQEEFEQPINKTYKCKAKNCSYQTVSFRTLMQHYNRVHHYSEDEVKQMKLSQSDSEPSETLENSEDTVSLQGHDQSEFLLQATTKPYTCEAKSCQYQSVTSKALMKHYINIHGYSEKEVKEMEVFQLTTFRPFKCHLCTKSYKNKKQLKIHYINVHQIKRAIVAQMSCAFKRKTTVLSSSKKKKSSKSLKMVKGQAQRRDNGLWSQRCPNRDDRLFKSKGDRKNGQVQTEEKRPGSSESSLPEQVALEGDSRGSRRLATKGNQSYILNKYNNHFHCVHKNCSSAFSTQKGLVSHLQSVHHYNPSQLCFSCEHKGCDKQFNHYSSLTRHYHRVHNPSKQSSSEASTSKTLQATSEEPIPRFKCTYANCNQSYHLNSSLLRHTSQFHQNQSPNSDFKQSYNKHVFYRHCEASDSLVVRLQSNPIKDDSNSGCQTKLIILPSTQQPKDSQKLPLRQSLKCCQRDQPTTVSEENFEPAQESAKETDKVPAQLKFKTKSGFDLLLFRTHEEALQMCQDRCQPAAFPCVLQDCDSVLTRMSSLHRHYLQCHKLSRTQLKENQAKLCYTTEQLEEIIQKKSAVSAIPDVTRIPSGVLKMEYQSEPVTPGGPSLPMSLHSIKPEPTGQDVITFSGEPRPDSNLLIAADDLLYGESNGHPEEPISEEARSPKECSMLAAPPLIRPPPLDLSPPSTLRIAVDDSSLEPLAKDNCSKTVSISVANPARQPLRRRNTLSESAAVTPHSPISKDPVNHTLVPEAFDIGTYKPLGFESSFLKFIKEKEEEIKYDRQWTAVVTTPCLKPDPPRRRECFRRSCSVKENNQSRAAISRSRRFRSSPLRHLISKEECTSIQNFRLILERALRGCGDQAIKQLQFLKPVVVLERPKSSASILDLLPPETKV